VKGNFHAPFWSSGRRRDPSTDCNGTRPAFARAGLHHADLYRVPRTPPVSQQKISCAHNSLYANGKFFSPRRACGSGCRVPSTETATGTAHGGCAHPALLGCGTGTPRGRAEEHSSNNSRQRERSRHGASDPPAFFQDGGRQRTAFIGVAHTHNALPMPKMAQDPRTRRVP
jgi:hypothetical protein